MKIQVLEFQKEGAISILQVATEEKNTLDFISSGKAIEDNLIEVTEVSDSGSVNNLKVANKSDKFVFFMDGDILVGAKQNRVMNISALIEPNRIVDVPVSCVEAGRWGYRRSNFYSTDYSAPAKMRYQKMKDVNINLDKKRGFYAEQSNVWKEVSDYEVCYKRRSATSDCSELFANEDERLKSLTESFKLKKGANGFVIFKGKKMLSTDIFNRDEIFDEYFGKILKGVGMDIVNIDEKADFVTEIEAKERIEKFFARFDTLNFKFEKGIGVGEHKRFEASNMIVSELSYEAKPVHISVLSME